MFIYTVKASRLKFFALILCSVAVLLTLAAVVPRTEDFGDVAAVSYDYGNIRTNEDRVAFLKGFGYEAEIQPVEVEEVKVPDKFDSVYERYNDVQRAQGLNLKRYTGKTVTRYTYKITNYEGVREDVFANLLIYNNSVIGGDVCALGDNAFIHGFARE